MLLPLLASHTSWSSFLDCSKLPSPHCLSLASSPSTHHCPSLFLSQPTACLQLFSTPTPVMTTSGSPTWHDLSLRLSLSFFLFPYSLSLCTRLYWSSFCLPCPDHSPPLLHKASVVYKIPEPLTTSPNLPCLSQSLSSTSLSLPSLLECPSLPRQPKQSSLEQYYQNTNLWLLTTLDN